MEAPDTVQLPTIHIHCNSNTIVNRFIDELDRGDIFTPHMSILPEALSVDMIPPPPDLVVRFGCKRDPPPPPTSQ